MGRSFFERMVAHALDGYPLEACGLLSGVVAGEGDAEVRMLTETENVARSARIYEIDPKALFRADRDAEDAGQQLIGVYHSHTHTEAKPSPTDIAQAPDPDWHYVLVSLRDVHPSVRSWRIRGGQIEEERIALQ